MIVSSQRYNTTLLHLQDPCVVPHFPGPSHILDTHSIATEVNYLYNEEKRCVTVLTHGSLSSLTVTTKETMQSTSPKLMDRFLNECQQRVWESNHEPLSDIPPPQQQESNSKLNELCQETIDTELDLDIAACEGNCPISSESQLNSGSTVHHSANNTKDELDVSTTCAGHTMCSTPNDYIMSVALQEHCFTDDEGYIHF